MNPNRRSTSNDLRDAFTVHTKGFMQRHTHAAKSLSILSRDSSMWRPITSFAASA